MSSVQFKMVRLIENIQDVVYANKDEVLEMSFKDLNMDSLDILDFLHQVREEFNCNVDIENLKQVQDKPISTVIEHFNLI